MRRRIRSRTLEDFENADLLKLGADNAKNQKEIRRVSPFVRIVSPRMRRYEKIRLFFGSKRIVEEIGVHLIRLLVSVQFRLAQIDLIPKREASGIVRQPQRAADSAQRANYAREKFRLELLGRHLRAGDLRDLVHERTNLLLRLL